jgi:hypothetical protein
VADADSPDVGEASAEAPAVEAAAAIEAPDAPTGKDIGADASAMADEVVEQADTGAAPAAEETAMPGEDAA